MKKSKVVAISLSAVALTTVTIVTSIALIIRNEDIVLLPDNFIRLETGAPQTASLKRIEGTNDWEYNVGMSELSTKQLWCIHYNFLNITNEEMFKKLGLSKENLCWFISITKNGKDVILDYDNDVTDFDEKADKTKPQKLNYKVWLFNYLSLNIVTKKVEIPFSITMIPSK